MMSELYTVIFVCLSGAVVIFLLMVCLKLFNIERTTRAALITAERKILKTYSRR